MNEKKVILDFLDYAFRAGFGHVPDDDLVTRYLAEKEPQEKDPEWFLNTHWTENRA